ncbi:MAG: hypothetical protein AAGA22_02345, partial [Pseudomonadota bacterium]
MGTSELNKFEKEAIDWRTRILSGEMSDAEWITYENWKNAVDNAKADSELLESLSAVDLAAQSVLERQFERELNSLGDSP